MSTYIRLKEVKKIYSTDGASVSELVTALSAKDQVRSGGKVAVDKISLVINEGDRLGIVGRNGAGKSTLLHMIAGISNPTSGDIEINGKVTSIMTLGVGLRDDLTGRENIYVDGEIQGKSRSEINKVIEEIINFSELGKFIDYPIRTYSTGMKARLAFSMIAHIDPEILIIDEALSVGDSAFASKAAEKILEICSRGKIVILVSHGMQSIRDICNRCIYIKDGRVVMDGPPEEVTRAYIEEVRGEDEEKLIASFASQIGVHSSKEGFQVSDVQIISGDASSNSLIHEAGDPFRVLINLIGQSVYYDLICRVSIVRLDGLSVFQEDFAFSEYTVSKNKAVLELDYSTISLAPSIYRLDINLGRSHLNQHEVLAGSVSIFKVFSLIRPSGGNPMLYYPIAGSSRILENDGE